jgi:hypothetical protein
MHLEKLLHQRLSESLVPTLASLEDICKRTEQELSQVSTQLQSHDIRILRQKATTYVREFVKQVDNLLGGSIIGDPDKTGESLPEEKLHSGVSDWPDFTLSFNISNANLKVALFFFWLIVFVFVCYFVYCVCSCLCFTLFSISNTNLKI